MHDPATQFPLVQSELKLQAFNFCQQCEAEHSSP